MAAFVTLQKELPRDALTQTERPRDRRTTKTNAQITGSTTE